MFLDDRIVEMVLERNPQDYDSETMLLSDIIKLCHDRLSDNLQKNMNDKNILPSTKHVCNLWDSASRILKEKGYPFLKIGGFKRYLLAIPDLAKILIPLGF